MTVPEYNGSPMEDHFYLLQREYGMPINVRALLLRELVREDPEFINSDFIKNQMALINSIPNPHPGCDRIFRCGEDVEMILNIKQSGDFNPFLDACLVIEFIAYQQSKYTPHLNYVVYKEYLENEFEILEKTIFSYSPYHVRNDEYLYINSDPLPPIYNPEQCIEILKMGDIEINGFADLESTDLASFHMSCDSSNPTILTFGQFMKACQMMIGLKIVEIENGIDGGWIHNSKPFLIDILEADFYCMYKKETGCNVEVHLLVDYLHQVVISKNSYGNHTDGCKSLADSRFEYPFLRKNFLKFKGDHNEIEDIFEDLLDNFGESGPTIYELGAEDISFDDIIDWENSNCPMDRYF